MSINAYTLGETETPEQTAHLDSVVHSGVDGLVLGCIDEVGRITYREALRRYAENYPDKKDDTPIVGTTTKPYLVTWEMVYEADNHLDAIAQAYAEMCEIAKDPTQGANYVTVAYDNDHSIKTHIQIDEALNLLGERV